MQIGVGQVIRGWDQGILGAEGIPPMKACPKPRFSNSRQIQVILLGQRDSGRGQNPRIEGVLKPHVLHHSDATSWAQAVEEAVAGMVRLHAVPKLGLEHLVTTF